MKHATIELNEEELAALIDVIDTYISDIEDDAWLNSAYEKLKEALKA